MELTIAGGGRGRVCERGEEDLFFFRRGARDVSLGARTAVVGRVGEETEGNDYPASPTSG